MKNQGRNRPFNPMGQFGQNQQRRNFQQFASQPPRGTVIGEAKTNNTTPQMHLGVSTIAPYQWILAQQN